MQVRSRFRSLHSHVLMNNNSKLFEFAASFQILVWHVIWRIFVSLPCLSLHFTLLLSVTAVLSIHKFKSFISSSFLHLCYCLLFSDDKIRPYFHNKEVLEKFSNMVSYFSRFVLVFNFLSHNLDGI